MNWNLISKSCLSLRQIFTALTLSLVLASTASPAFAQRDNEAEAFVGSLADRAMEILSRPDLGAMEREEEFRVLFVGNMDIPRIGLFALGQYARTPTPEQKAEYFKLVEEFIVKVYSTRLSDYNDQKFSVLNSQPKGSSGKEVIVSSEIIFANGRESVPVEWWLLRDGDTFKVFDVKVVGIWMAQEQRSTFISVIRNSNGDFPALLNHLQTQVAQAESRTATEAENQAAAAQ